MQFCLNIALQMIWTVRVYPSLKDSIDYNLFCKIAKETNRTTTSPIISFHRPQLTTRNCDTIKCTLPPISHSKTIFEYCAYLFNSLPDETKSALLSGISKLANNYFSLDHTTIYLMPFLHALIYFVLNL